METKEPAPTPIKKTEEQAPIAVAEVPSTQAQVSQAEEVPNKNEKVEEPRIRNEFGVRNLAPFQRELMETESLIIAFFDPQNQILVKLKPNKMLDCKYGHFEHNAMIGKPFGSKILSKNRRNYLYTLRPDRQSYTTTLTHRTQILYHIDIGSVINKLDIRRGLTVCESGTGSGSLSFSISESLGKTGKLFTFEFNKERAIRAKEELDELGVTNTV